jgi:hypothetical protein
MSCCKITRRYSSEDEHLYTDVLDQCLPINIELFSAQKRIAMGVARVWVVLFFKGELLATCKASGVCLFCIIETLAELTCCVCICAASVPYCERKEQHPCHSVNVV